MTKAAPRPQFRARHQPSIHGIAMDVSQLLDALGFAPDIEIVVARLPERPALGLAQLPRNILLEHLQRQRELRSFRLGDEQVNMLRHNHVSGDVEPVPLPRTFESLLKNVAGSRHTQASRPSVAAKCEKVQTARFLKSLKTPRHSFNRMPESGTHGCDRKIIS